MRDRNLRIAGAAMVLLALSAADAFAQRTSTMEERLLVVREGGEFKVRNEQTPQSCRAACLADAQCRYWDWFPAGRYGGLVNCRLLNGPVTLKPGAGDAGNYGGSVTAAAGGHRPVASGTDVGGTTCLVWVNRVPRRKLVEVAWQGGCVNGTAEGAGTALYPNGDRYEGGMSFGWPHGQGVFRGATGEVHSGTWREGCFRAPAGWIAVGRRVEECDFR
jgi:hypothetical protein